MFPSRCGALDGDFFALELARVSRRAAKSAETFPSLKILQMQEIMLVKMCEGKCRGA
jgi:hypothetical protein